MKRLLGILALTATIALGGIGTSFAADTNSKPTAPAALRTYPTEVNYDQSVKSLVLAGKYDWIDPAAITEDYFPPYIPFREQVTGTATLNVVLVPVSELTQKNWIRIEDALDELDRQGYRPLNVKELLAFGAKYLDEQRKYSIIALGSVWQNRGGHRGVLCLYGDGSGRYLVLGWYGGGCRSEFCRFAAVHK